MSAFNVGDQIAVRPWAKDKTVGEIVAFRHVISPGNGQTFVGCDVLTARGTTQFRYLHDIARDNPDRLAMLRMIAAAPDMLAALKAMADDYQTSEVHHPNHVLVSLAAFTAAQAAIARAEGREG